MIWEIYVMYTGFNDQKHALSFESTMQLPCNSATQYSEKIKVAESLIRTEYQFVYFWIL